MSIDKALHEIQQDIEWLKANKIHFRLTEDGEPIFVWRGARIGLAGGSPGPPGADGSVWHSGSGVPAGGLGSNGDFYLNTANGDIYEKGGGSWSLIDNLTGPQGIQGIQGDPGVDGDDGAPGADGRSSGFAFEYDNATTASDPGSGKLKLDDLDTSSASELYISEIDLDTNNVAVEMQFWTALAIIEIRQVDDPTRWAQYTCSAVVEEVGDWRTVSISPLGTNQPFQDGATVHVQLMSRRGSTGATGSQGIQGIQGIQGVPGNDATDDITASTGLTRTGDDIAISDAELLALRSLTSAPDKGIQFTGSGTAATFDLTTAGKNLLDDANATAQRATLSAAGLADANTFTLGQTISHADGLVLSANGGKDTLSLSNTTADVGITIGADTNLYRTAANILKTDDTFHIAATGHFAFQLLAADAGIAFGGDAFLYRNVANELRSDGDLVLGRRAGAGTSSLEVYVGGNHPKFKIIEDGKLEWGDSANAVDTNLYREAADILATDDKLHIVGELEIDGALNHDGTTFGLYGVAPVARPAAYTQTYATAARTHAAQTSADFPAGGAGTAAGGWSTAANRDLAIARFNALRADLTVVKNLLNSVIDDLQANGILQ